MGRVLQMALSVKKLHALPGEGETCDRSGEQNNASKHPSGTSVFGNPPTRVNISLNEAG